VRRIYIGVLMAIMLISFVFPFAYNNAKADTTQYPRLNQITFISYNGNDLNGIEAFTSGAISMYTFPIPPNKITSLPSNYSTYIMPIAFYDVLLNPLNTSFGFNPFMFQPVRYAMNYIVDRSYFVNNFLGGYGTPTYGPYAGEFEGLMTSNASAPYIDIHYNLTYANQTIYNTLIKHGAQYINGKWYYNGKPITIYFFVRTDTIVRQEYAKFLESQLQQLGFTIQEVSGNLQKQNTVIYGSDPHNSTWNIAVESWSGGYSYYDYGKPIEFLAPLFGAVPATSNISLTFGAYDDSMYETPDLFNTVSKLDAISLQLYSTQFNTSKQYYNLLNQLVSLGINDSIRVFVAESQIPIYGSSILQGVLPSVYYGNILNTPNYMTMSTPTGITTIGVRYLSQGSMNPGLGFTDAYSVGLAYSLIYPLSEAGPNGYSVPTGVILKVVNESNVSNIPVPTDAITFNTSTLQVQYVEPNTTAELSIIANFAPLMNNDKFADNQSITLADIINIYLEAQKMLSPNSSISDPAVESFYSFAMYPSVIGFKIINSTTIQIWGDVRFFDPLYAAETLLGNFLPLGGYSPAEFFPWQEYSAMNWVVSHGLAAWDKPTATAKGIDWLSIVSPKDVGYMMQALNNYSSTGYIPQDLMDVQKLSGFNLVNETEAVQGYKNLINFINKYGNAFVSDGPFILTSYSVTSGGAVVVRNPNFNLSLPSVVFQIPMLYTLSFQVPSIVGAGQTLTGQVLQTPDGSKVTTPAPNVIVYAQLVNSNGEVVRVYNVTTNSNGQFSFTLPPGLNGKYYLRIFTYTYQNIMMDPTVYTLLVVPSITTTTSTTSTPPSSTTTSTTSTPPSSTTTSTTSTPPSSSTVTIVVAAVVVIIVIVAAVLLIRRR
jgi:peptide/nickel transport system substrate-binding protein